MSLCISHCPEVYRGNNYPSHSNSFLLCIFFGLGEDLINKIKYEIIGNTQWICIHVYKKYYMRVVL